MDAIETELKGAFLLKPQVFGDHRGFFLESFSKQAFIKAQVPHDGNFVQDNHSLSKETGTLRGLHYQLNPKAQAKLVRCTHGAIYDVIVDIRRGSPTFGMWQGFTLSAENMLQLLVPTGFAHGFVTLEANTEVHYKVDQYYAPECDRNIVWNDPDLAINWPVDKPILSSKDENAPLLKNAEINFEYEAAL